MGGSKALALAILLISLLAPAEPERILGEDIPDDFSRSYFPPGFTFGTATSAYQIEGAANKFGRGPSTWDEFTRDFPERIVDASNGDVAVDFYNRYREDIARIKEMGLDAFRFSISWSRVIPSGRIRDGVNEQGIEFYNNVINETIANGLTPFVTLFHWDLPQGLQDKYGGFLNRSIVDDFQDYAELCFRRFGDRVKYWITLNEPWSYISFSYDFGAHAPGRCVGISSQVPHRKNAHSPWLYVYPKGIRYLLNHTKNKYDNPVIYITENGIDEHNNETQSPEEAVQDQWRTQYYQAHLWNVLGSIREYNVNVKGYFAWSYLDNYDWSIGYTSRFGLFYVDYKDNLARRPKQSAEWFQKFLKNELSIDNIPARQCHSGFIEADQQNSLNGCQ
ncbi:hypothetical protein JCGZ_10529 [Jatropha curcas]|uniref:Beta-glucosidase n=1 Tax=Jatropha curcas TaxID=180498 RepID=A0A067KI43_JATCU|nr:hypothetical protein JCGZ_10529 [Jatropha curcas]